MVNDPKKTPLGQQSSADAASHAPKEVQALTYVTDPDAWAVEIAVTTKAAATAMVHFAKSGVTAEWTGAEGSILELAEAHGIKARFSCREGLCHACRVALEDGTLHYDNPPLKHPKDGRVLICCAKPAGDISLTL